MMLKKSLFGISLVLAIAMCFALLIFPILKYDKEVVQKNNTEFINQYIEDNKDKGTQEEKEILTEDAVNSFINQISNNLQIYGNVTIQYEQDENGNLIYNGVDSELQMFELDRLRNKGIKYKDLASGIKNQISYDNELRKILKNNSDLTNKEKNQYFFQAWINPIPFIFIVILIALEFACAFLVIVRSIKGIMEKRKTKLLAISIFGCVVSLFLLVLPTLFSKQTVTTILPNNSVSLFISSVRGTGLCYYYFIGFAICIVISIFTKLLKN